MSDSLTKEKETTSIVPTKRQLQFQDWEFGLFLHVGMYTYYETCKHKQGKYLREDPNLFNPTKLDCDQWIRTAYEAGMRYAVLTCKHHEGFCLWPSEHGDYSVKYSSWRDGKGDVVKDFTDACHTYGLKVGIYYSPFDNATPLYKNDHKGYDDYFIAQMSELLSNYGTVDMLWFDGCHSEGHVYDWPRIIGEIHRLAPDALVFNMGEPDFRWVGNEYGIGNLPNWNVVEKLSFSVNQEVDQNTIKGRKVWLPAECDCRMRLHSWGWNADDEHTVKSVAELMGLYYYSVGRGCNLLLNIGPNPDGLLPEKDRLRLLEFGKEIKRRLGNPVATLKDIRRDGMKWIYEPRDRMLIDHVMLQEDIAQGEHIHRFRIGIFTGDVSQPIIVYEGQSVGHKAICQFPAVSAKAMIIEVTDHKGEVTISNIEFYFAG